MNHSSLYYMFNREDSILLSAMIYQSYQLFEKEPLVLPKGYSLRYTIRALAGVEDPEAEVFGFIAESQDQIIVIFRGTRTFKDNESDQDLYQVPYPFVRNAGKTHRGFTCLYQSTRNELIGELTKLYAAKRILVAGHSLGGALAVLAAFDIAVNTRFKNPFVYTYGSPRVADPVFASRFNQTVKNSIRIFNIHDIIPTLPDQAYPPPFTKQGLFYQHVDKKVTLSFQLNSLPVRNHEIVCYFKNLSQQNPAFAKSLCDENPGFCPDTELCVPFMGGCGDKASANHSSSQEWNFVSAPALHPMKVSININKPGAAPGLIFVAPYTVFGATMIGQTGALIIDQAGNPVWFRPLDSRFTQNTDFRVQSYKGEPVLTMWQGTISGTQSEDPNLPAGDPEPGAFFQIINQNYKVIKKLTAKKGFTSDVHEFTITKQDTALFTAVKQVPADLTMYGGPADGYFDNYSIQEVDLETGELLFFWDVLAHVNPDDSMLPASSATSANNIWDCFHVNSVEEGPNNTLLISMRNMWAIYLVDKTTGKIVWQLGGKKSDFTFEPNATFSWQHDARFRSRTRISLFDDACCASSSSPPEGEARGLILQLDFHNMTAKADRTYYHDPALYVPSQGNVQKLSNGNQFVGWGQEPYLSEYRSAGNNKKDPSLNLLYDMQFPGQNLSYRAFKDKWVGLPFYPPSIAVNPLCEDAAIVYASWNGSTETVAWKVLAGPAPNKLSEVGTDAPRTGFETDILVHSIGPYFQVKALNSSGQTIGTSQIIHAGQEKE